MTCVYLIQAGDDQGPVKIGFSDNVKNRLESLRTGNHLPLRLIAEIECPSASDLERALHGEFAPLRMEGEWFRFDHQILNTIAAIQLLNSDTLFTSTLQPQRMIPEALMDRVRAITNDNTDDVLEPIPWVVEWSHEQGYVHLNTLAESVACARDSLIFGRGEPTDYVIVAIVDTKEQASRAADVLKPWLKAMRFARRVHWKEPR